MATIVQCYSLAKRFFSGTSHKCFQRRLEYAVRLFVRHHRLVDQIESFIAENPARRDIFALPDVRKLIYGQQMHPCFYRNSSREHRLHFLKSHFLFMERTHKEDVIKHIYSSTIDPIVFYDEDTKLSFRLNYHRDMSREGLLWLLIEMNDNLLYKITFWFMEHNGVPTLCIGALQGGKTTLDDNRFFTKKFWGLRPQNMALTVLRWYAKSLGIRHLYTFPKHSLWSTHINEQTAITEFWQEQGATPVKNTPFIELALDVPHKDLAEVATRKRSMYKKRYDFLDNLRDHMQVHFELYFKPSRAYFSTVKREVYDYIPIENEISYI